MFVLCCAVWVAAPGRVPEAAAQRRSAAQKAKASDPGARHIVAAHIVSRVNGSEAPADAKPKRARADVGVTLFAVVEVRAGKRRLYYSDAGAIRLGGATHQARPMREAPRALLRWYKVEPEVESMSNTRSGSFRFESIAYAQTQVTGWMGKSQVAADVRPTLTPDRGDGVGTMRYRLIAYNGDGIFATPGADARRGRGSGGLLDTVHRVSLRRDDSYLGILTEMYGQPYIWASAGTTDRTHQSERLEGSDCADFMVYGVRRLGKNIPYTWTGSLPKYTKRLAKGAPRDDGVYVDRKGEPIPFPKPGDWILFPRHVGALVADRGVRGVLDTADVMMHTYFASPREQPIGESAYADAPIEVHRWRR